MKYGKRILAGLLSLVLALGLLTPAVPVKALDAWNTFWPTLTHNGSETPYRYEATGFVSGGSSYSIETMGLSILSFPEGTEDLTLTPERYTGCQSAFLKVTPEGEAIDLSEPAELTIYATDGRNHPFFLLGQTEREFTEEDKEARLALAERLSEENQKWWSKINELESLKKENKVEVGGYHPVLANMLYISGTRIWYYADANYTYRDKNLSATAEDFRQEIEEKLQKTDQSTVRAETITRYLDTLIPYYLNYVEEHRIASPEILDYAIGDSKGIIDLENKTVTIRMPEDTDWDKETVTLKTPEGVKAVLSMGSPKLGKAIYVLTPWEETTGVTYDGVNTVQEDGWGCGVNLSAQWALVVESGDPYNELTGFGAAAGDGSLRYAKIDGTDVRLNLPMGTDLTALRTSVEHTGQKLLLDGQPWNGESGDFSAPRTLSVVNEAYGLQTDYTVTVTADRSDQNEILSFSIGDRTADIDGTEISITLPYAADLEAAEPKIEISEFAVLSDVPEKLEFDVPLSYTVTAENGDARTYHLTIHREAVSTSAEITEFRYGGIYGAVDSVNGTISLEVPENTDVTRISPIITVSDYATVSPASGETVDFTGPVVYTVTSQSGLVRKAYTVTVTKVAGASNPYKGQMQQLVGKIINKYTASVSDQSDDWTLMNIGLYQNQLRDSLDDLPAGFDMAAKIRQIDTGNQYAMTTLARVTMMLTALGVNCTDLDHYSDGEGFADAKGAMVHDLVSYIYNYSGGYTINGPAFALIALDMGNYTVPENAVWTREKLLDVLLAHEYGTDNFGIDMVGAIMYAIAPYQNDAVYGARVRDKLDEGLAIILGEKSAPGVAPMQEDLMFFSTGTVNSEAAGWVIMALCSMGIDPQTDPRFIDGKGNTVISQYMTYADDAGFAHTATVRDNHIATYEACYVMQWYLSFLDNGGAGHPRHYWYHRFDFSRQLSKEARIERFVLDGQEGVIDEEAKTIQVMVPSGMNLSGVTPELTLSEGAALKAPALPVTFVEDVSQPFTIVAEDGVTMSSYQVTVSVDESLLGRGTDLELSSITLTNASILREVEILERSVTENTDSTDIVLKVGAETDITNLYMKGTLSYGASAEPDILSGTQKLDLSGWNQITVTSEDKSASRIYRIRAEKKAVSGIGAFYLTIDGVTYEGTIDDDENTIRITGVPSDADVKALAPEILLTEGTTVCSPLTGVPQNFTVPVSYTVSGENMDPRTYTVHVTDGEGNYLTGAGSTDPGTNPGPGASDVRITGFAVCGVDGVIDHGAGTILVTLPTGTDVSAVAPDVSAGIGCTVSPVSGEVVDLRDPAVYTVTDGSTTVRYTVLVVFEESISRQLWEKMEENSNIVDHQVVRD